MVATSQINSEQSGKIGDMKPYKLPYSPERLKDLRKARGLTQIDLADKCGINEQSVRKLEANKMIPSEEMLMLLGEVLNVLFYADWENKRELPERKKPGRKRS